jgi:hypothetical protein
MFGYKNKESQKVGAEFEETTKQNVFTAKNKFQKAATPTSF